MAGEFDDLIPQSAAPATGGGAFDDLVPAGPTPEQQRAERLRKIARTAMQQDPGAGALFSDAFTLGLQKPVAGLAQGVGNVVTGQGGFGEGYTAGTGAYQQMLDEASQNAGWGGTAANVAGSLLAGGPARGVVQQGILPMLRSALGFGAVEGAARNSEDVESAVVGGLKGAGTAAATAGTVHAAVRAPGFRQRRAAAREAARGTPPEQLRQQSRTLFRQLDEAGVAYDNNQTVDFVDNALSDLRQNGWSPQGVHSSLNGVIGQIEDLRGQPMSLERLQDLREQIGSEAGSNEGQVRRIAGRLLRSIDGFVTEVDPAMSALPREQIGPLWTEARRLWRTANVAADLGWRSRKATRRAASTNSGQNTENAIRQNIRQVVDKADQPGRYNPYNAAEMAQMERVVEGSPTQNILRSAGNQLSGIPAQSISGLTGAALGGVGIGGGLDPVSALLAGGTGLAASGVVTAAGRALKDRAAGMAEDEVDSLIRLVSTGSLGRGPRLVPAGPPTREALARLMREQALARGAGIFAAGNVQ